MSDYDYLPTSNGSGDAALMHVTTNRLNGSSTLIVDSIANVPSKFIATMGTALPSGFIDPATAVNFKGHTSGSNLIIDAYEAGSSDPVGGTTAGQIVVIKPTTGWSNRVAAFIKNASSFGTPEALFAAAFTAASATISGALSAASAAISGAVTVGGNITITGTSQLVAVSVATCDGSFNLTPTKQIFNVTALNHDATIVVPSFTPTDGIAGELQIKDDGTSRGLTWPSGWLPIGLTLPTATSAGKYMYIGYRYNAADSKFHVRSVARQS